MKELFLFRHAKAEKMPELDDPDRPLKPRGESDAQLMAKLLAKAKMVPDQILCSTALRTRRTAEILMHEWNFQPNAIDYRTELYLASSKDLVHEVRTVASDVKKLLLIGHNPGLPDLAYHLSGVIVNFLPTSGIFWLKAPIDNWSDLRFASCELAAQWIPADYR